MINISIDMFYIKPLIIYSETLCILVRPDTLVISDNSDLTPIPFSAYSYIIVCSPEMQVIKKQPFNIRLINPLFHFSQNNRMIFFMYHFICLNVKTTVEFISNCIQSIISFHCKNPPSFFDAVSYTHLPLQP